MVPERPGRQLIDVVKSVVQPVRVAAGEPVVRQGDEGRRLFVVDTGALDVVVTAEGGFRLPVARLGPGAHFGEMSLLASTPISADVVACEPSVLYAVSAEEFGRLFRRDPDLMAALAEELALRLKRTNERLSAQQQRQAALGKLIGAPAAQPFTTQLPSFGAKLTRAVERASRSRLPLLLTGEEGVGKRALAHHIHSQSERADRTLLVVDCAELPPAEAARLLFGDAEPASVTRFAEQLGYLQAADGGTLVLAHVECLPPEVQEGLAAFLSAQEPGGSGSQVDVRLIATGRVGEEGEGALHGALRAALSVEPPLTLRTLRRRRRDIVPLADFLLEHGAPAKRLTEGARRELLGYDFAFGNIAELKQVLLLAARLAPGEAISAEHLFFGPGGDADVAQVDLLRWPWLERAVVSGALLAGLKGLVAVVFLGLCAACLFAPGTAAGRMANLMVWGLWWPGLIVSLLLVGRAWCAVCPLSAAGEASKRLGGREREPPDRLQRLGPPVALVGFVGIVWVEQAARMTEHPQRTALLLIALAFAAVVFGWLFRRHAWCRYVCPLGAMGAALSVTSGLRVQARKEICGGSCTGHECYRGSATASGCPMSSHALFLTSGQHCKLCLECLRSCPSRSPRLILQPPLRDISRSNLIAPEMAPMVAVVGLVALLLGGAFAGESASGPGLWWFSGGCVATAAAGLALMRLFHLRGQTGESRDVFWTARMVYAYAPAAAALFLAFHLRSLPWLAGVTFETVTPAGHAFAASLLHLAQWTGIAAGGLMTLHALWPLCRQRPTLGRLRPLAAWLALGALTAVGLIEGAALLG